MRTTCALVCVLSTIAIFGIFEPSLAAPFIVKTTKSAVELALEFDAEHQRWYLVPREYADYDDLDMVVDPATALLERIDNLNERLHLLTEQQDRERAQFDNLLDDPVFAPKYVPTETEDAELGKPGHRSLSNSNQINTKFRALCRQVEIVEEIEIFTRSGGDDELQDFWKVCSKLVKKEKEEDNEPNAGHDEPAPPEPEPTEAPQEEAETTLALVQETTPMVTYTAQKAEEYTEQTTGGLLEETTETAEPSTTTVHAETTQAATETTTTVQSTEEVVTTVSTEETTVITTTTEQGSTQQDTTTGGYTTEGETTTAESFEETTTPAVSREETTGEAHEGGLPQDDMDSVFYVNVPELRYWNIRCGTDQLISIDKAVYGKDARNYTVTNKMRELCRGLSECSVLVNNLHFGDPAFLSVKSLTTWSRCKSGVRVFGEGELFTQTCAHDQVIKVEVAYYGNDDWGMYNDSTDDLVRYCDGKQSCSVPVSNDIFGNPAVLYRKSLKVIAHCIPCDDC